jgi:hypothetical protein
MGIVLDDNSTMELVTHCGAIVLGSYYRTPRLGSAKFFL